MRINIPLAPNTHYFLREFLPWSYLVHRLRWWAPKYTEGFAPLPGGLDHIPFNDIEAARAAIGDDVCAVVVEPVQGEGGVLPATVEYLQELRKLAPKRVLC